MKNWMLGAAMLALPAAAAAEVKSASPTHFVIENKATAAATPAEAYAMLGRVGAWWNGDHTYSGDAANLTLEMKAGGCFCETMPDGGTIEHMRTVYAASGATLRLAGGLGPLQAEAVAGTLTFTLKPVAGGTEITQSYVVAGYVAAGADTLAPVVDRVLAEQLAGLQRALAR